MESSGLPAFPAKSSWWEQAGRRSGLGEEGTSQRKSASAERTAFTSQRQPRESPPVTPPQKSQVLGFYKFYSELRNQFYNFGSELRTFFLQKLKWNNSRANFENPKRIGVAMLFHWNFSQFQARHGLKNRDWSRTGGSNRRTIQLSI